MSLSVKSGIYTMTKGILENLMLIHKIQPAIKDEHSESKFSKNAIFFWKQPVIASMTKINIFGKKIRYETVSDFQLMRSIVDHANTLTHSFLFFYFKGTMSLLKRKISTVREKH